MEHAVAMLCERMVVRCPHVTRPAACPLANSTSSNAVFTLTVERIGDDRWIHTSSHVRLVKYASRSASLVRKRSSRSPGPYCAVVLTVPSPRLCRLPTQSRRSRSASRTGMSPVTRKSIGTLKSGLGQRSLDGLASGSLRTDY